MYQLSCGIIKHNISLGIFEMKSIQRISINRHAAVFYVSKTIRFVTKMV